MQMSWVSLLCDVITILPFVGWGVMSLFAIPSYAASGWLAPVVIAVFSTLICGLACRGHHISPRPQEGHTAHAS